MKTERKLYLGVVADDFTGAGDAASFLRAAGLKTLLLGGTPAQELAEDCDAAVIALKSRSVPARQAVSLSLEAFRWLERAGAQSSISNTAPPLIPPRRATSARWQTECWKSWARGTPCSARPCR